MIHHHLYPRLTGHTTWLSKKKKDVVTSVSRNTLDSAKEGRLYLYTYICVYVKAGEKVEKIRFLQLADNKGYWCGG